MRNLAATLLIAALAAAPGCAPPEPGVRAWEEGRFADAADEMGAAVDAAGDGASPALLHDLALASLRAGRIAACEAAARRAEATGGPAIAARAAFLLGNAAWARCDGAESETFRLGQDLSAFDRAIALAESARDAWARAAAAHGDWPEARRNAERAILRVARLRVDRARADREKGGMPGATGDPRLVQVPPPAAGPGGESPPTPPDGQGETGPALFPGEREPTSAEIRALVLRLVEMEDEKHEARRRLREATGGGAERDW